MKYSEFHRRIRRSKSGWVYIGAEGSHYIYERNGVRYPVPYHGAKEMGERVEEKDHEGYGITINFKAMKIIRYMKRMTKRKLRMILSKGPEDFGAWLENIPGVYGAGDTPMEAKKNLLEGLRIYIKNNDVPAWLRDKQYVMISKYDSQSLLQYYKGIFTNAALERITGINQKQIQHYASGLKKPREAQLRKIETGLHKLADELMAVEL